MEIKGKLYRRWWFTKPQADQAEAWLADLSNEGWQLESVGMMFARFVRHDEARQEYLIMKEPKGPYQREQDLLKEFATASWRYVCNHNGAMIFAAPAGTAPPEAYLQEEINKRNPAKRYRDELITLLVVLLAIGALLVGTASQPAVFAGILLDKEFLIILAAGFLVYGVCTCIWLVYKLTVEPKQREEGILRVETQPYRRTIREARVACLASVIYHCPVLTAGILGIVLAGIPQSLPQGVAAITAYDAMGARGDVAGQGSSMTCEVTHGIFIADRLEADNFSAELYRSAQDGTVYVQYEAYRAISPWIASKLAEGLAADGGQYGLGPLAAVEDCLGFDKLWLGDGEGGVTHGVVALRGQNVCCVSYSSPMPAAEMAGVLAAKTGLVSGRTD